MQMWANDGDKIESIGIATTKTKKLGQSIESIEIAKERVNQFRLNLYFYKILSW